MVTIKQIAKLAGVSRGTVDRVLNQRGSVNPETASRVNEIAKALNYTPNIAGRTLAVKKKKLKLGYILFGSTSSNPFFSDVVAGIKSCANELAEYGVQVYVRFAKIDTPNSQISLIDELLQKGIHGLAIAPINHPDVEKRIKALSQTGFPIITANSDVPNCGRLAYVGSNYFKSGETAAGLMNLISGGEANVGIVIGSPWVHCHSERASGFRKRISECYQGIKIVDMVSNYDDDIESFSVTQKLINENPEIDSLFLAAAGISGACKATKELGKKLKIICYDTIPTTQQLIKDGEIIATIAQQPFTQGKKPLELLFNYLAFDTIPDKECYYTKIEIKIRENL